MDKWFPPPGWMTASSAISIGGLLNGYDTGAIGAVTTMAAFEHSVGVMSPSLRGFTVSFVMLMGAVPAFFAGRLADRYGHLHVVMVGALTFLLGAALEAGSFWISMFLIGRALEGFGQGLWLTNVSVYITEIAPAKRRGMLVSMPQLMSCLGLCLGYFTCYGSIKIESSLAWRLPFILMVFVSVILAVSCVYLPDSPRFLMYHGHRDKAMQACERLGLSRVEVEKDILRLRQQDGHRTMNALQIFQKPYRMRTTLALIILGMVQLSGIDGVIYYAPILFNQAGLSIGKGSFLASGLSAILILVASVPAFLYADAWGRRTCTIVGGIGLSSCMLIIGSLYASKSVHDMGIGRWVVVISIFVFGMTYATTWGIVGKIYASEIQPVETRTAANSVAQGLNFFTNWLVAFATPIFLAHSSYGAYFLFGGLSFSTLIFLAIFMPETRGKSLESIQDLFATPDAHSFHLSRRFFGGSRVRSIASDRSEDVPSSRTLSAESGLMTPRTLMAVGGA